MPRHGFVRIAVCSPRVTVGHPAHNVAAIVAQLAEVAAADVVVFPEL
jgi:predicted amidohydrolase